MFIAKGASLKILRKSDYSETTEKIGDGVNLSRIEEFILWQEITCKNRVR